MGKMIDFYGHKVYKEETCENCGGNLIWDESPMTEIIAECDTCGLKIMQNGKYDYTDCENE